MRYSILILLLIVIPITVIYSNNNHIVNLKCVALDSTISSFISQGDYDNLDFKKAFWPVFNQVEENNCPSISTALNLAGYLHYAESDLVAAKEHLIRAESIFKNKPNQEQYAQNQIFLGLCYILEDDFDNSIICFKRAALISKEIGLINRQKDAELNLGLAYFEKGDFDKAETYFLSSKEHFDKESDYEITKGYNNHNLARVYAKKDDFEKALFYSNKADEEFLKADHNKGLYFTNIFKAELFQLKSDKENRIKYLLKAIDYSVLANTNIELGHNYFDLALAYQDNTESKNSIIALKETLKYAKDIPEDKLLELINLLSKDYFNNHDKEGYNDFVSNILDVIQTTKELKLIESGRILITEKHLDSLRIESEELISQNAQAQRKFRSRVSLFIIIVLLLTIFSYWLAKLNRDKQNLIRRIKNQNKELTLVNDKLNISSKTIQAQNKLLESKNEELKNFAFIASHDLKSPIRTILNYTGLLELKLKDKLVDKEQEILETIKSSGNNMYTLVTDLLDYARLDSESINSEEIIIRDVIKTVLSTLSEEISEKHAEVAILDNTPKIVFADLIKMRQVFQNLISNALRYSAKDRNPMIVISGKENEVEYTFHIEDNGIGIADEYKQEIFQMFKKLNNSAKGEGSGIGLSICSKLIELHKGRIWVESEVNVGSIFSFSIPKGSA